MDGRQGSRGPADGRFLDALRAGRNADGGWGYQAGHPSRLEPTAWAALALRIAGDEASGALTWIPGSSRSTKLTR